MPLYNLKLQFTLKGRILFEKQVKTKREMGNNINKPS